MMTTLAAIMGGIPLAIGIGQGSELRQPLGISVVGGLILSQALTLYTTPIDLSLSGPLAGMGAAISGSAGITRPNRCAAKARPRRPACLPVRECCRR